jgi:Thioester domain
MVRRQMVFRCARLRVPVLLGLVLGVLMVQAASAGAAVLPKPAGAPREGVGTNTDLVMSGTGPGQGVTGFIANADDPFDPVAEGYPASNPTTGFTPLSEGFAGIIHAHPAEATEPVFSLYCIDILTPTFPGIGYGIGAWDSADVPNVGYVARVLEEYYPHTDQPAALTDLNQKAAAVQAAVWFFSDRYVLSTSDPLYATVVAIVDHIRSAGPLVQPPPPSLTITPAAVSGAVGRALGPFTVTTNVSHATVTATGGSMYSNRAGTVPIADGALVPSGQKIWLRSTGTSVAVLQATSEATVPTGNVYLYDGN